jgi:hypothetical protein
VKKSVEKFVKKSAQKSVENHHKRCVFARKTPWNIVFEVLVPLRFQKYSICQVYMKL